MNKIIINIAITLFCITTKGFTMPYNANINMNLSDTEMNYYFGDKQLYSLHGKEGTFFGIVASKSDAFSKKFNSDPTIRIKKLGKSRDLLKIKKKLSNAIDILKEAGKTVIVKDGDFNLILSPKLVNHVDSHYRKTYVNVKGQKLGEGAGHAAMGTIALVGFVVTTAMTMRPHVTLMKQGGQRVGKAADAISESVYTYSYQTSSTLLEYLKGLVD